jgi:hypothetical protein
VRPSFFQKEITAPSKRLSHPLPLMRLSLLRLLGLTAIVLAECHFLEADGYDDWKADHFSQSQQSNSALSGETADPDNDGIPNLLEYVFNCAPLIPDAVTTTTGLLNNRLTLTYRERNNLGGAQVWLQASDNLQQWITYNTRPEISRITGPVYSNVTLQDPVGLGEGVARRFIRLRVDRTVAALAAPTKVAVDFNSPTEVYVRWTDPNTSETGYKVTHYDYTLGERVAALTPSDVGVASGIAATPQTGYTFKVGALGSGDLEMDSDWATPSDRDGDGMPDYLERRGQTIIAGTYDSDPDSWDTDGDGLSDYSEIIDYKTNPASADTDGDGLPDGWEVSYGFNPNEVDDTSADPDADGLSNLREYQLGTYPNWADTDNDGLTDGEEADTYHTHPLLADTDGDNLNDGPEVFDYQTDPSVLDTDADGLPDGWEVTYGLNPLSAADANLDPDGDTLTNLQEYSNSSSPLKTDTDNDGLDDAAEVQHGTKPSYWDSDYDGMSDAYEIRYGLNANDYADADLDPDNEGLTNIQEYKLGTSPNQADTDGDGASDAAESSSGADPADSSDDGQPPLPSQQVDFALQIRSTGKTLVGNCAVCHNLQAQVGSRLVSDGEVIQLRRDKAYEIKLIDKPTEWTNSGGEPPHENTAQFTLWPNTQTDQLLTASSNGQQLVVSKSGVLEYYIDNNANLLGQDIAWKDNVLGKTATVGMGDLDVVHPATGELAEEAEDLGDGGYIAIKRTASTPITQLIIHARPYLVTSRYRLKFDTGGRYKLYRNAARTEEVISEITHFSPATDVSLYFEGISKSATRGGEKITLQIQLNGQWLDADSVRMTVVQAEFPVNYSVFIPYQWVDIPIHPDNVLDDKIARGDDREFSENYLSSARVRHRFVITPYKQIDSSILRNGSEEKGTSGSINYRKSTSVPYPALPYTILNRLLVNPQITEGPQNADLQYVKAAISSQSNMTTAIISLNCRADEPIVNPSAAIDWDITISVTIDDPINPKYKIYGVQDGFPAYEFYIESSSQQTKIPMYLFFPPSDATVLSLLPTASDTTLSPNQWTSTLEGVIP